MRYWAYINNEVCGPCEKEKLKGLPDFSLSSLLCPELQAGGETNSWKEASAYPEVAAAFSAASPAAEPSRPAAESPLALTMRGSLIAEPVLDEPAMSPTPLSPQVPKTEIKSAEKPPEAPSAAGTPSAPPQETAAAVPEKAALPEPLGEKLDQVRALLGSLGDSQAQLAGRLDRLESALADIKAMLLPPPPPQKK